MTQPTLRVQNVQLQKFSVESNDTKDLRTKASYSHFQSPPIADSSSAAKLLSRNQSSHSLYEGNDQWMKVLPADQNLEVQSSKKPPNFGRIMSREDAISLPKLKLRGSHEHSLIQMSREERDSALIAAKQRLLITQYGAKAKMHTAVATSTAKRVVSPSPLGTAESGE